MISSSVSAVTTAWQPGTRSPQARMFIITLLLPSCRLAGSLVLLDLHHGKHLLDIEIEIVRLLGVPLDLPDQPRLVGIPQGKSAYSANHLHLAPPSSRTRSPDSSPSWPCTRSIIDQYCVILAGRLQRWNSRTPALPNTSRLPNRHCGSTSVAVRRSRPVP